MSIVVRSPEVKSGGLPVPYSFERRRLRAKLVAGCAALTGVMISHFAHATLATSAEIHLQADPGSYTGGGIGAPSVTWIHGVDGIFSSGSTGPDVVQIDY